MSTGLVSPRRRHTENVDTPRITVRMKWFDPIKGYGFAERSGDTDLMVHVTCLPEGVETLDTGQWITCQVKEREGKGLRAVNVELADAPA